MQIGEEYLVRPEFTFSEKTNQKKAMWGKVIWVHPKGRYAELEFDGGIKECFYPDQLSESNRRQPGSKRGKRKERRA